MKKRSLKQAQKKMWLVPLLVYSQVILSSSAPTDSSPFRSNTGVALNGRKKVHGDGEKCPTKTVSNCRCRAKSEGLDITCENVNANQLYVSLKQYIKFWFNLITVSIRQTGWKDLFSRAPKSKNTYQIYSWLILPGDLEPSCCIRLKLHCTGSLQISLESVNPPQTYLYELVLYRYRYMPVASKVVVPSYGTPKSESFFATPDAF